VYFKSQVIPDKETVRTQPSTKQPTLAPQSNKKTPNRSGMEEKESKEFLCAEVTKFWENL